MDLETDRTRRYQHASDMRRDLARLERESAGTRDRAGIWRVGVAAAAVLVAMVAVTGAWLRGRTPSNAYSRRSSSSTPMLGRSCFTKASTR